MPGHQRLTLRTSPHNTSPASASTCAVVPGSALLLSECILLPVAGLKCPRIRAAAAP